MNLPECHSLDTMHLQRLFDNMSECYKMFWFRAIVDAVAGGSTVLRFDDIVDDMIANAWYMVTEYKLNLGPADTLEALVLDAQKKSNLKSSEKRDVVVSTIRNLNDKDLQKKKQVLTYNVPYRLQAPFLSSVKGKAWDGPKQDLADRINAHDGIIYRFGTIAGLESTIIVDDVWADYIKRNYDVICGWIQYNLIVYLQRRNPNVPGISSKLYPPQERNLDKVKRFWKAVMEVTPIHEIYGSNMMDKSDVSIDHFVPWSYVAHDEMWNLSPTTRSINSKKSNNLPDWNRYFPMLQDLEFKAYMTVWNYPQIHKEFDRCIKEHVNSVDVQHRLYRHNLTRNEFYHNLEEIIKPVYEAAQNMGFDCWRL